MLRLTRLLVISWQASSPDDEKRWRRVTKNPSFVDVRGRRIRHLKAGPDTGTPVLLIHGFGADLTSWMFNQASLAEKRPVYAIDLPGHGGSTKEVPDGSVEALAASVLDYMDAVGISRAHLIIGHSLGAAIAVQIALVAPGQVEALTLVAPAGLGTEISGEFIEGFIAESRHETPACAPDARR